MNTRSLQGQILKAIKRLRGKEVITNLMIVSQVDEDYYHAPTQRQVITILHQNHKNFGLTKIGKGQYAFRKNLCKHCDSVNMVKNGHNNGNQLWLCKDCGKQMTNLHSPYRHRRSQKQIDHAIELRIRGYSLRMIEEILNAKYTKKISNSSLCRWFKEWKIQRGKLRFKRDGHRKHMERARAIYQDNGGTSVSDWAMAQILASKPPSDYSPLRQERLESIVDELNEMWI